MAYGESVIQSAYAVGDLKAKEKNEESYFSKVRLSRRFSLAAKRKMGLNSTRLLP